MTTPLRPSRFNLPESAFTAKDAKDAKGREIFSQNGIDVFGPADGLLFLPSRPLRPSRFNLSLWNLTAKDAKDAKGETELFVQNGLDTFPPLLNYYFRSFASLASFAVQSP